MTYGILSRPFLIRLSIVFCLVCGVCITSYSACSCGEDSNAASGCCSDKSGASGISTGGYTCCCCDEPANSKRQGQVNPSNGTGGCLWCANRCDCATPAKKDIAVFQRNSADNWRRLCTSYYFIISSIAHLENQHHTDSEYLATIPLSTFGRHINVILCVFLC